MKRSVIFILFVFLFTALSAQTKEELQVQKQKAFDEIKLARELMERTNREKAGSLQQIRIVQKGINSRAALIAALEQELQLIENEIAGTSSEIERLKKENELNREEYARLIYYAFRNHTDYENLMYILAASSISQSYQRYKYLKYIGEYRKKKAAEIEAFVEELDRKGRELLSLKEEKLEILEEKDAEQKSLISERGVQSRMLEDLKRKERRLKAEIQEKEEIARELEARIRAIIEEEARRASTSSIYAALTPEQELLGNDFRKNKGKLPWPVEKGIVTTGYGDNEVPGLRGSTVMNNGIDINSEPGTEVRAVFEGEVTKVVAIKGLNYVVLIRHGAYLTVYANLVDVRVKTGDKVLTKETIGKAFTDAEEDVSLMHFELWQEKTLQNPELWLSK